jgi:hypothetical protein
MFVKKGDPVEVLWLNDFAMGDVIYGGRSWWQACVLGFKSPQVLIISFTGWDEIVDVNLSDVRYVRCSCEDDLTCPIPINTKIELRCASASKPEIWFESIVREVVHDSTYIVQIYSDPEVLIGVYRDEIRPMLISPPITTISRTLSVSHPFSTLSFNPKLRIAVL